MNTPPFIGHFVKLLKAAERQDARGKWQFSIRAHFAPGTDLSAMNAALREAKYKKFGPDPSKWPGANWRKGMDEKLKMASPWKLQDELVLIDKSTGTAVMGDDGLPILQPGCQRGGYYLNLHTQGRNSEEECEQDRPDVVDHDMQPIRNPALLYSGAIYVAEVGAFGYFNSPKAFGVSFGLNHVQKIGEGEPIGGRIPVSAAFKKVKKVGVTPAQTGFDDGAEAYDDPLAGLDGME